MTEHEKLDEILLRLDRIEAAIRTVDDTAERAVQGRLFDQTQRNIRLSASRAKPLPGFG